MDNVIDKLSVSVPRDDSEYLAEDGLLHCKRCGGPREVILRPHHKERAEKQRCVCKCMQEARNEPMRRNQMEINREACFRGSSLIKATFTGSDDSEGLRKGANYAKNFSEMRKLGKGLIFYGPVGTGKTHIAACIANEVINQGYLARLINLSRMIKEMNSSFSEMAEYIRKLSRYDLLIIDDLGIERSTEYMNEQVFDIFDSRLQSGLPLIVTTNLSIENMANYPDIEKRRVYERVLEHCHPVEITGSSRRMAKMKNDFGKMEQLLRGE